MHPFKEILSHEFEGGIRIAETIYSTNIMGIVGGGKNPQFPPNKVLIWDECKRLVTQLWARASPKPTARMR